MAQNLIFLSAFKNLVFASNQILPVAQQVNNYLTLYLLTEEINNPKEVTLKELIAPIDTTGKYKDPKYWKLRQIWIMDVNLN